MDVNLSLEPTSHWPALQLTRDFLYALFASQAALGTAWAIDEPAMVIAEASDGDYRIALLARPKATGNWTLHVVASPPVHAQAVISIGDSSFRAPFDHSGTATMPDVPGDLLTAHNGSQLEVQIEPLAP